MGFIPIFQKQEQHSEQQINESEPIVRAVNNVVELPVAEIAPNPSQPRFIFDDYELSQLAVSIQQNGVLQPITVRRVSGERPYELISGERRLRAAKLISLDTIPAIVIEADDRNSAVLAILENIQRSDLNFIEEALAIKGLIEHFGITQEEAAAKLGVAQSTVANKLRLLRLTDEEKAAVLRYRLNERQARALLKLPNELRIGAVEKISALQLNTAQTDKFIDEVIAATTKTDTPKREKRNWQFKQVGLYINSFNQTIKTMKEAGISCTSEQNKTDEYIEYLVRIKLTDN
ncbi:MAG: ParB/RepB/Spo0J family partition protein [Oscillospiraceae bacterium]|nr:ParB/RepB/Spo0J family partition protein [Oscillospiraceae bacterium]